MPRFVQAYLLATPLFAVLDAAFGINIRAVFLDESSLRWFYYLASFGAGAGAWRWPRHAALLGRWEAGVNLALLILGTWIPILNLGEILEAGLAVPAVLTPRGLANVVLSGTVFAASFYGGEWTRRTRHAGTFKP